MKRLAALALSLFALHAAAQPVQPPGVAGQLLYNLNGIQMAGANGHVVSNALGCASTTPSSSSTAYTCSTTFAYTPVNGDVIFWQPGVNDASNTVTAPTLAVNGGTARSIILSNNTPLIQGDVGSGTANSQANTLQYSTSAAAPCSGACWYLDAGDRNNILSTYQNSTNNALRTFYACNPYTTICRIVDNGDSEHVCYLTSSCAFGPLHQQNLWAPATMSMFFRRGYAIYSSGMIGPLAGAGGGLISNGILPGITSTSGTVTQIALAGVGPQQATGAITGGGTLQMAAGAVVNIGIGSFIATPGGTAGAFNRFKVYCAINATTGTMTITISGQAAVTACNGTNGSAIAQAFTATNTAGTTALTVAITCTAGTCNLGGWETIYTTGNTGYAIDAYVGVSAGNSYWLGAATSNCAYLKLTTGVVALLDVAIGINDAVAAISSATVNANITTFVSNWPAASVLIWSSFPYTGTGSANYPAIQAGQQQLALTNGWDYLNTADNQSSNTSVNWWAGLENSDLTHPSDMGAASNFNQWWAHINASQAQAAQSFGSNTFGATNGFVAYLNSGDQTSSTDSFTCYTGSLIWCGSRRLVAASNATFQSMEQEGLVGSQVSNIASNGGVMSAGSWGLGLSTTAGAQTPTLTQVSLIADATNHQVSMPYNTVVLTTAYTNATTTFSNVADGTHTLQFALNTSETKVINCSLIYQASATTDGLILQFTGPASPGAFEADMQYATTYATAINADFIAPVTALATQFPTTGVVVNAATTNYVAKVHATIVNGASAGNLVLQAKGVGTGTLTIGIGSMCHAE